MRKGLGWQRETFEFSIRNIPLILQPFVKEADHPAFLLILQLHKLQGKTNSWGLLLGCKPCKTMYGDKPGVGCGEDGCRGAKHVGQLTCYQAPTDETSLIASFKVHPFSRGGGSMWMGDTELPLVSLVYGCRYLCQARVTTHQLFLFQIIAKGLTH